MVEILPFVICFWNSGAHDPPIIKQLMGPPDLCHPVQFSAVKCVILSEYLIVYSFSLSCASGDYSSIGLHILYPDSFKVFDVYGLL